MFRALEPNEIDVRVQQVKGTKNGVGCVLLLYKDARCDMRILDETFTPFGWTREHKELKGNIYCGVTIEKDGKKATKWDCGSESFTEKEKGEASDSFKRACFNWGVGRELYTSPFIWINLEKGEYYEDGKDKYGKTKYKLGFKTKFKVFHIKVEDGIIKELGVADNNNKPRFKYGK